MRQSPAYFGLAALGVVAALGIAALSVRAQPAPGMRHDDHGTPKDWKFAWPKGDPGKGREAFVKLECYTCHEVRGEPFPAPSGRGKVGPELSAMGPLHDGEYFAEAIVNPGAVIERGKGYAAPDGSSKMPSYNDSVTGQEGGAWGACRRGLGPPPRAPPLPPPAPAPRAPGPVQIPQSVTLE